MKLWWPHFDDIHDWLTARGFRSRDWGLLAASLDRPLTTLAGQEMYPGIWSKVAAAIDSISRNRPLVDGNKRLAFLLASLVLNGNEISDRKVSDDEWYDLIIAISSDRLEVEEIAARLRALVINSGGDPG